MSRSLFPARVLSAATLSAMLLGTACSDSTAPVTEQEPAAAAPAEQSPAAPASPGGDTPAEPQDTATSGVTPVTPTISAIVRTDDWVNTGWVGAFSLPGIVARPSKSAVCMNVVGQRTLAFGGVQVTNLDYQSGRQAVWVRTNLWRYNSSLKQLQLVGVRDWSVPYTHYLERTWMSVPTAVFYPTSSGTYTVSVEAYWYVYSVAQVRRHLYLNLAADFDPAMGIAGQSSGGLGYCYMP